MTLIAEKYIDLLQKMPINDRLEVLTWIETHQEELLREHQLPNWNNDDFEAMGAEAFFDDWTDEEENIWSEFYQKSQNQ